MTEKKYRWIASSSDGAFQDESKQLFNSKEDCYNDMRNNALEKMKWNTEFKHDYFDCESISYGVIFSKDNEEDIHVTDRSKLNIESIKDFTDNVDIEKIKSFLDSW